MGSSVSYIEIGNVNCDGTDKPENTISDTEKLIFGFVSDMVVIDTMLLATPYSNRTNLVDAMRKFLLLQTQSTQAKIMNRIAKIDSKLLEDLQVLQLSSSLDAAGFS